MIIDDKYRTTCNHFVNAEHDIFSIGYIDVKNHSNFNNPLLIEYKGKDNESFEVHLFDSYKELSKFIKPLACQELDIQNGWYEGYCLEKEDIDTLELYEYYNVSSDVSKILDDAYSNLER